MRRIVAFLAVVLAFAPVAKPQSEDFSPERFSESWRWVRFTTESGLPSDHVTNIFETSDGDIWAVCPTTVAWFDGYRWFGMDSAVGLQGTTETSIDGEMGGKIIVFQERCGVYLWNRPGFIRLNLPVGHVYPVHDSIIFLQGQALVYGVFPKLEPKAFHPERTWSRSIHAWSARAHAVLVEFGDGLYKFQGKTASRIIPSGSRALEITQLSENAAGTGMAIVRLPPERAGIWEWSLGGMPKRSRELSAGAVIAMDVAPNGDAVIVHTGGIISYRHHGFWQQVYFNRGLVDDIRFTKFRNNGDLWVGTQKGLFLWKGSSTRWRTFESPPPSLRNETNELFRNRTGELWVGTGDGLDVYTSDWRVNHIPTINGTALGGVTGLNQDSAGNMWISSGGSFSGTFRWDGRVWKHFEVGNAVDPVHFHKIRKDERGRLWFLGMGHNNMLLNPKEPGIFTLTADQSIIPWPPSGELPSKRIYSFAEDSTGAYWVGYTNGLSRWYRGAWIHRSGDSENTPYSLASGSVLFVGSKMGHDQQDRQMVSVAWVDSSAMSISRAVARNIPSGNVQDITYGTSGSLWVSMNTGLYLSRDSSFIRIGRECGLATSSILTVLPEQKQIVIGTDGHGIQVIGVDALKAAPPIVFFEPPFVEDGDVLLRWYPYAYWGEPEPGAILTRIRIDDLPWGEWSASHYIELRSQSPGEHRFHVQVKDIFGSYAQSGSHGKFTVPAPMFRRTVFVVPMAGLSIVIGSLFVTLLMRRRRYFQELEEREEQFRSATNTTPSAIFIVSDDRITFVNPGAALLSGYSDAELVGMRFRDLIVAESQPSLFEIIGHAEEQSTVNRRTELIVRSKAGDEVCVDLAVGKIQIQGRSALLFNGFDVTERVAASRENLRKQEQLRMITGELVTTEERERKRMATFLHDMIGQSLAFAKIKLGLIEADPNDIQFREKIRAVRSLLDHSITNTRSLTFELSPPALSDFGIVEAIRLMGTEMFEPESIDFAFRETKSPFNLDSELRVVLYYAVRELFNNVIKHAGAHAVTVDCTVEGNTGRVTIHDDGVGMGDGDARSVRSTFGLFNIRERLENLGAKMELNSQEHHGTTVTITVPMRAQ